MIFSANDLMINVFPALKKKLMDQVDHIPSLKLTLVPGSINPFLKGKWGHTLLATAYVEVY